ncbi:PTS mannose/fructose/sorbose transporter subunit IIC [Floricoccus tropicus]|uniref:PTS mannose/fructose/sorbose transporter subunit IIC n=2 Tax=Floricoccus TaxID=1930830 RepID=A0A1E8GP25_9LACT|nr:MULTISPECIES: mannose/fructose/sorbose family PTS transporter subunit IIC [Floricoccus]OFI46578.1 PTS mannose/fructose/sorbose transporter subunit IIC [Floricoccus penangensis]OFI49937.1 PTS mannose/fructose/sorbose transporter subunit IIC [Floricoccus tropicus]URZ86877.1 mannose/fructose/sorbose family PTS transporter subunit IIC [Floricoccus penangensis]
MEYGVLSVILILIFAFLAGMEGILDSFELHQPVIACSLIGIATGHIAPCVILGGSLQILAAGWANIGAAVAPDAALASVASAIILVQSHDWTKSDTVTNGEMQTVIGTAILLATAGLVLTTLVRLLSVGIVHRADAAAEQGNYRGVEMWHIVALMMQGLRIAIPAGLLLLIPASAVQKGLLLLPDWFTGGMAVGGGMVVAVGYAMVINLMASREVWPFFFLGFALAPIKELTLIAMGIIGVAMAFIYLALQNSGGGNGAGGSSTTDPIGDILNDY